MDKFVSKFKNFWFYYKKHLLIGLAVLLICGYLALQDGKSPDPDYHIGLVRATPCTPEEQKALEDTFTAAGVDVNGDGQVLVQIHTYWVDLSDSGDNADVVQALDADLIGNVSGIFLLEDPEAFQLATNGLLAEPIVPFGESLFIALRQEASDAYIRLISQLS